MEKLFLFSTRLKELMTEHNLTNRQLQQHTGISNQAINNWLNSQRSPTLENLWILSEYFGCTIDYLVGKSDY